MAHPEDLVKLSQGPKAWNAWRQEDPDHIPDLRDAELTMSQRQFGPGNGGPIDLSDADLQGMVLRNSTLTDASLVRANIVATDLVQARLDGADMTGADLTDAVLDYSDLTGANLNGAILVGASLVNVTGLTQDQIAQAHGDASTALPAYLLPPESWFPALEGDLFDDYDSRFDLTPLYNDPYEVLGVERNATFDEIRTAFRTLVKKLHPDLNPDDAVAQERFKRVSIAYRILGDPVKRDRFNRGEIDTNGDVCPEFEAKKEFRRYAFRFYFAAAASLLLAAGILGGVWYTFWMQSENGSTRTAEAGPPKLIERLTARKAESEPEKGVAAVTIDEPVAPPTNIAAVTNAIEASENLADGNVHRNAAVAQSAEEAVQDGAASAESLKANTPDNAANALATDTLVSIQNAADETGSGSGADNAASNNVGTASAEQVAASSTIIVEAPASPTPPFRATASELNAVRPALGDGKSSEAGQQKLASTAPAEAVEISQTLSSATSETASLINDENNKLATLVKDIKTLVSDGPLSIPAYQPQWPSAHGVVLKKRSKANFENDSISDVFRHRTMSWLQDTRVPHTATEADSLQIPREDQAESKFAGLKFDLTDLDFEAVAGFPEILIHPDATAQFLLQKDEEESLVDTAAVEAKTADRREPSSVTQSQY